MYCQTCGHQLATGSAVCSNCKKPVQHQPAVQPPPLFYPPVYPMPLLPWRSVVAGILLLIATLFCLLNAFYIYDYYILWYDGYEGPLEMWVGIMSFFTWAFGMGLVSAVLTFKRFRYLLAGAGYIIVFIAGIVTFVDFYGPGSLILFFAFPALVLFLMSKRDFDLPKFPIPPMPMPPPIPGAGPFPPMHAPTPYDKLRELKKLKDEGIISEEEYESKRKQMLDRL